MGYRVTTLHDVRLLRDFALSGREGVHGDLILKAGCEVPAKLVKGGAGALVRIWDQLVVIPRQRPEGLLWELVDEEVPVIVHRSQGGLDAIQGDVTWSAPTGLVVTPSEVREEVEGG